jgi:AcrR family transcriptional regulator
MENTKRDKRQAILIATMELIAEHGFHNAPTSRIAEKAGVAIGTIYRYFENKDDLIIRLHEEIESSAMKEITLDYDRDRPIRDRFSHVARRMLTYVIKHPLEFRFVEQFYNSPYGIEMRRDRLFAETEWGNNTDILKELYEDGRSQQIIKDFGLSVFFALSFGSLFNVARDHIAGFVNLDDSMIEKIVAACWDAVKLQAIR